MEKAGCARSGRLAGTVVPAKTLLIRLCLTRTASEHRLLIRPCEVLSRIANPTILEVANNALRVLLQHRHMIVRGLA